MFHDPLEIFHDQTAEKHSARVSFYIANLTWRALANCICDRWASCVGTRETWIPYVSAVLSNCGSRCWNEEEAANAKPKNLNGLLKRSFFRQKIENFDLRNMFVRILMRFRSSSWGHDWTELGVGIELIWNNEDNLTDLIQIVFNRIKGYCYRGLANLT